DVEEYRLQADNHTRPYVIREDASLTWTVTSGGTPGTRNLVFEGLWLGIRHAAAEEGTEPPQAKLILAGVWDRVVIRHCTLDPGGQRASELNGEPRWVPYVQLEVHGHVEELIIESSITGPIVEHPNDPGPGTIGKLIIRDSIVSAIYQGSNIAIDTIIASVHIERSTILGTVTVNRLYASGSLFTGAGTVTDLQNGCFRFSAGVDGEWPHPFESHLYPTIPPAWIA